MLPFVTFGVAALTGIFVGKKLFHKRFIHDKSSKAPSIEFIRETIHPEPPIVLSTEEVPLDNRFGSNTLISEHEFARTATVQLRLGQTEQTSKLSKANWWPILEGFIQKELGKNRGVEFGSQIARRVKITFSAEPGKFILYKVIWKQESCRGSLLIRVGHRAYKIPFFIAYGLSHSIESLEEKQKSAKKGQGSNT
ncbi:MAG: hypothetical protein HQL54_05325 [Magnetococcales bacterium]|nr:hypothetical protein [Magnetococcales bacterium]